jgi:hypothetical protein
MGKGVYASFCHIKMTCFSWVIWEYDMTQHPLVHQPLDYGHVLWNGLRTKSSLVGQVFVLWVGNWL